jgi:hypothetical protein
MQKIGLIYTFIHFGILCAELHKLDVFILYVKSHVLKKFTRYLHILTSFSLLILISRNFLYVISYFNNEFNSIETCIFNTIRNIFESEYYYITMIGTKPV